MPDDIEILDTADAAGSEPAAAATELAAAAEPAAAPETTAPAAEPAAAAEPEAIEVEYPEGEGEGEAQATAAAEPKPEAAAETGRFGPSALTRALAENQPLAAALEAAPRLKSQLYQMARRSQELALYQDVVPSLARAREAVEAQRALGQMDESYYAGEPQQFWQALRQASGESGAYERHAQFLHKVFLDRLEGAGLGEAVDAIRGALGWGNTSRTPGPRAQTGETTAGANEKLPLHIRQKLEAAEQSARELQQLRSRLSEGERQANEKFMDETATAAGKEIRGFVDGILAKTGLSDYDRTNIARDFLERVAELADQDKVHNAALEEILRAGGATPAVQAQMVQRITAWTRQNGRDILEPILARAGAGLKQRQERRETARASARPEPRSTGAPAQPARPHARDLVKQAQETLGRRLSDLEILNLA